MNLQDYRNLLFAGGLIAILVAALPAASVLVTLPKVGEEFSELWLLGPNHMAENYPFNVTIGEPYSVYLGIGNHMGNSVYYLIYVKFKNQTQPLPNATTSTPSPVRAISEIRAFVPDGGTLERHVTFSVSNASQTETSSSVSRLAINNRNVETNSSAVWDPERKGFYYQLLFELWIYDVNSRAFGFHNRFIWIWLNMTA